MKGNMNKRTSEGREETMEAEQKEDFEGERVKESKTIKREWETRER